MTVNKRFIRSQSRKEAELSENKAMAARMLKVKRTTLVAKLRGHRSRKDKNDEDNRLSLAG